MTAQGVAEAVVVAVACGLVAWGMVTLMAWLLNDIEKGEQARAELRAVKTDLANWGDALQWPSYGDEYRNVQALALRYARERRAGW